MFGGKPSRSYAGTLLAHCFDWLLDFANWRSTREGVEVCDFALEDFRARSGLLFKADWRPHFDRWARHHPPDASYRYSARRLAPRFGVTLIRISRQRARPAVPSNAMTPLSELQDQILALHAQGKRPRRMVVPRSLREEFEREMCRGMHARSSNELPLHLMGVLIQFGDVTEVAVEYDEAASRG